MIKLLGYLLIASPFVGIAIISSSTLGVMPTIGIFAVSFGIMAVMALGCWLAAG